MNKGTFTITTSQLKCIVLAAMLIDHMVVTFPQMFPRGIITLGATLGGIVFPVMAFLLVQGAMRTRNLNRYLCRLFLFWMVSIIPFYLAKAALSHVYSAPGILTLFNNVGCTLFFSLLMVKGLETCTRRLPRIIITAACFFLSLPADWGGIGVVLVLLFYIFRRRPINRYIPCVITVYILWQSVYLYYFQGFHLVESPSFLLDAAIRSLGPLLAVFLLCIHHADGQKPSAWSKWGAYLFYPAHLVLLWMIATLAFGYPV